MDIIQIFIIVLGPYLILCNQKTKVIDFLSPVVVSYLLGIFLANIPFFTVNNEISKMATEASVPLAIPLLLFSTHFMKWIRLAKSTVLSFVLIIVSVLVVTFSVSFIFRDLMPNYWKIAGMLVGVYTGGTPNMTAIGMSLDVKDEVFILMNGADLLLGASYLLFVLTIGYKLFGKFLPPFVSSKNDDEQEITDELSVWKKMAWKFKMRNAFGLVLMSGLILGISLGLSNLIYGKDNVAAIILVITTLGIAGSFITKIREINGSYEVGQYLLLIFCTGIGSMANIQEIMNGSLLYLSYCGLVMVLSITMHLLLCRYFKVDRDTAVITSVAGIFGPPFVGPMAEAMGNREIIVSGLTSGLVGYAVGNYLGIALAYFVKNF